MPSDRTLRLAAPALVPARRGSLAGAVLAIALAAPLLGCEEEVDTFFPNARYTPDRTLPFDATNVASKKTLGVVVLNTGNAGLRIADARVDGAEGKFTVEVPDVLTQALTPGRTSTITVTYTPCPDAFNGNVLREGFDLTQCPGAPDNASLVITDNTQDGGTTIQLSGTPVQPPNVELRCARDASACNDSTAERSQCVTLNFGQVTAGQDEPCDMYLEVVNANRTGPGGEDIPVAPLVIANAEILVRELTGGSDEILPGDDVGFALLDESGGEPSFPLEIPVPQGASRGSELLRVRFSGTTVGSFSGAENLGRTGARFNTNDPNNAVKIIGVLATGSAPDIQCRQLIDFGAVAQGTTSTSTVTCSNQGDISLEITDISLQSGNPEFTLAAGDGMALAPRTVEPFGGSFELYVTYTPTDPANDREFIDISSSDPDENPLTIEVRGGPTPGLCTPPQVVAFEPTVSSAQSESDVVLESCGTGVLRFTRIDIVNNGNPESVDDFSIDTSVPEFANCGTLPCDIDIALCPGNEPDCTVDGETPGIGTAIPVIYRNNDASTIDLADLVVTTNDPTLSELLVNLNASDNPCRAPVPNIEVVTPNPCVPDPVELRVVGNAGGPTGETATLTNCDWEMVFSSGAQMFSPDNSAAACDQTFFLPIAPGGLHIVRVNVTNSCGSSASSPPEQITIAPECN